MSDNSEIFALYEEIKSSAIKAQELGFQDLHGILNYVSDRLVMEYHKNADDPVAEAEALTWDKQKWPSATALLLEMKCMIKNMQEAQLEDPNGDSDEAAG